MIEHLLDQEIINEEPVEQSNEEVEVEESSELEGELEGNPEGIEETVEEGSEVADEILGEERSEEESEEGTEEEIEEQKAPEKHKLKINNEDFELSTDELITLATKSGGADQKFREASKLREQAKNLVNNLKDVGKLEETLLMLGVDVDAFVNNRVAGVIEYESMSEDQKRAHDYKLELNRLEKENAQKSEMEKRARQHELIEEEKGRLLETINKTIETNGILPKNKFTVAQMAKYMREFKEAGVEPPMDRVASRVLKDYKEQNEHFFSKMDQNKVIDFIGDDVARKISSNYGKKLNKNVYKKGVTVKKSQPESGSSDEMSMSDFRAAMRNI